MDKTPKSKHFGFKSKNSKNNNLNVNWHNKNGIDDDLVHNNMIDQNILENKSVLLSENLLKTPPVSNTSTPISNIKRNSNCCSSPQFVVGWNEGSQTVDLEMNSSPVNTLPTYRRIRRCPESLFTKECKSKSVTPTKKFFKKNSCDILQCISWAKNLTELTSPVTFESSNLCDDDTTKFTNTIKSSNIDLLDDSSNELMILCSQAVENEMSSSTHSTKKFTNVKHLVTPESDRVISKKPRNNSNYEELNINCGSNHILSNHSSNIVMDNIHFVNNKNSNESCTRNIQTNLLNDFIMNDNSDKCTSAVISNNNKSNLYKHSSCNGLHHRINYNNDANNLLFDDEDEIFTSLDLECLDSLQNNNNKSTKSTLNAEENIVSKTITMNNYKLTSNISKPLSKLMKEEIEKRRLEAKKRLFNKKYKSM